MLENGFCGVKVAISFPEAVFRKMRLLFASSCVVRRQLLLEKQRNAPDCSECNKGIYNTGNDCTLSPENPGYKVKLKNPDKPPVNTADDGEYQSNFIKHLKSTPFVIIMG